MDRLALPLILIGIVLFVLFIAGAMRPAARADEAEGRAARRAMTEVGTDFYEAGTANLGIFASGNGSQHQRIIGDD